MVKIILLFLKVIYAENGLIFCEIIHCKFKYQKNIREKL